MTAFQHIEYAVRTDVGRKRKNNEDAFGVFPDAGIFCVADGMGGGDDGEIASAAVIKSVGEFAMSHIPPTGVGYAAEDVADGVSRAVNEASAWISARAAERKLKGCGSTFVGICLDATVPSAAIVLHAGDSRLYRVRGSSIKQVTKDHSAAELIGAKDEKSVNPMFRGMILRAVGVNPSVDVESTPLPLRGDDRIVICSDGLSKMVDDKAIAAIVHGGTTPEAVAEELIAAANEAGGTDNVTAVVIFVGKLPLARPAIAMEIPETSADATADTGEPDTSSTGADGDFGADTDTADESRTMSTMAVMPQRPGRYNERPNMNAAMRPLLARTAEPRARFWDGRNTRVAMYASISLLLLAIAVWGGISFVRRVKARAAAAEVERQRNVQKLAEANAAAVAEGQKREIAEQKKNEESVVESAEQEPEKGAKRLEQDEERNARTEPDEVVEDTPKANGGVAHVPSSLVNACSPTNSEAFVRTVRRFPNKGAVESLLMRFRPLCDETLPVERRSAIATAVTADVQDIARDLRKYAERRVSHIDAALSEHTTRVEFKEKLAAERRGLAAFLEATESFAEAEPSSAETQTKCADIMLGVAKWFIQVN